MENAVQMIGEKLPLNLILGIVFDTKRRRVLIVKRKRETSVSELKWCFPGGKIEYGDDLEEKLKKKILEKTGLKVESLGSVFAETQPKSRGKMLSIYYLCEFVGGREKLHEEFEEMKWVSPREVEKYFGKGLPPNLSEYLANLK